MAHQLGIKKPQICQAGSAETFEDSSTTGAEQLRSLFNLIRISSQFYKNNFVENDRPSYPNCSGRAPWALVTGAEPLNLTYLKFNSICAKTQAE